MSSLSRGNRGDVRTCDPEVKSLAGPVVDISMLEPTCAFDCAFTGLWTKESSSVCVCPDSILAAMDGRERAGGREDLEVLGEGLFVRVVMEVFESREGGTASGKAAFNGDCSADDGTETITGEDTAVPVGLLVTTDPFLDPGTALPVPSYACSFAPPTDARMRL